VITISRRSRSRSISSASTTTPASGPPPTSRRAPRRRPRARPTWVGLTELLCQIDRDYDLPPLYITENGAACADQVVDGRVADFERIEYLRSHLDAIAKAVAAGVDVRGFYYWSLLDNFEWDSGYDKRFGIVHVDYATQRRTLKDSAYWFRGFIAGERSPVGA
jgi:beta-glucosidase